MVNQLPQGWKEEELGKHADIKRGSTITKKQVVSGDYPVVAGGKEAAYYHNEYNRQPPVITVSGSGASAGYVNYWEVPIFASDCSTIEEKDLNIKYIYYFLKSRQQELLDKQVGVAIPHVSPKDIYPLLIPYPTDEDEQEYIVKTLDAVAEMIKLRKETIQLTKDLIPAIFQEMFGDPITNPKGWEITTLGNPDVCTLQYGYTATAQDSGDTRYIRITDIGKDGYIDNGNKAWLNYDNKMEDYKLYPKDILVARTGASYGKTLLYNNDTDAIFASFLIRIIFNKKKIIPEFYWAYSLTDSYWQQANRLVSGVAQPQFNGSALKQILLMLPPLSMQDEFAKKVEQINQNLEVQQKDLDRLQELFDQLLQKAFTGELTRGEDYGKH